MYLLHKHTHFRCTLHASTVRTLSQTYSLPVYLHASTVRILFTNILTSGVPYTPVQCVPYSKHTHFRCTLHASTVRTLFTNILTSGVPYTPVQYVPYSQIYSLPVYSTRQYSRYLVHKHTHFRCILYASTIRTLFTNITTSGVPFTAFAASLNTVRIYIAVFTLINYKKEKVDPFVHCLSSCISIWAASFVQTLHSLSGWLLSRLKM